MTISVILTYQQTLNDTLTISVDATSADVASTIVAHDADAVSLLVR